MSNGDASVVECSPERQISSLWEWMAEEVMVLPVRTSSVVEIWV
jgi:hypothetical protein